MTARDLKDILARVPDHARIFIRAEFCEGDMDEDSDGLFVDRQIECCEAYAGGATLTLKA